MTRLTSLGAGLLCLGVAGCAAANPDPPAAAAPAAAGAAELHLVPWPRSVRALGGSFQLLDPARVVVASDAARAREIGELLAGVLRDRTGYDVTVSRGPATAARDGAIVLDVADVADGGLPSGGNRDVSNREAYALRITPEGVAITGTDDAGLLWGVQTLRQLLPPEFEEADGARRAAWGIPAVEIEDAPRFGWRGSLMDVARHFFPVDFVKRYVDLLSRYKMNVLHWHLTEDQGWRLEIEAYPRLTEIAAWRTEPDGSRHGGFYTREQVREVVEYARLRGVRVVPEIEMPGHSSAALVAYPELACAEPPEAVPSTWGVFRDIYCVGKPETFTFLEDVLTEVATLFPSDYVHIGGDEVPKVRWEECESCRELMRRQGLADEEELQAWFLHRIERHLDGLGKTMIGWDEILEGGGVPGAVVQVWRDPATIREAIERGHDVIASPTSHAYFDYSPAALPLERVYSFDPEVGLTPGDARGRVLGGEGNLWSEYITTANFDVQAFPRILALAEILWSGPASDERDFEHFEARLDADQYPRLRAMGVRPGPEASDVIRIRVGTDSLTGAPRVRVEASVDGIEVRYTTDGSTPTASAPALSDSTTFADGDEVVLGVFAAGEPIPIRRGFSVVEHEARGRSVDLAHPPDVRYPGPGPDALTDGLRGSDNHRDGVWQGWWDHDLAATIDLGAVRSIRSVELSFLDDEGAWILPPDSVVVSTSRDGVNWERVERVESTRMAEDSRAEGPRQAGRVTDTLSLGDRGPDGSGGLRARHVRVRLTRGVLPEGHPGAGMPGWLFVDEIVVR